MFKIKSQVEVILEADQYKRRKDYQPTAGSYTCPYCKTQKYAIEFINHGDTNTTIQTLFANKGIELEENAAFRENSRVSFSRRFTRECSTCQFPIDADIVFYVYKDPKEHWEIDAEICSSTTLEFRFPSFLALGIDIFSMLPSLLLRWWKKNWKIDLVVPFVKPGFLELFAYVAKYTENYQPKLSDDRTPLASNPFRDIIFRKFQERFRGKLTTLKDVVDQYYQTIIEEHGPDFFYYNFDGLNCVLSSFRQVVNDVKEYDDENLGLKYSGNFHAKFVAGIGPEVTELYLMSYNFGEVQSLQFETHFLTEVPTREYNQEVDIFKYYHRLKTEDLR